MLEVKMPCEIGMRLEMLDNDGRVRTGRILSYIVRSSGYPGAPIRVLADVLYDDGKSAEKGAYVACSVNGEFPDDVKVVGW